MLKKSQQRAAIRSYLQTCSDHPTAAEIHQALIKEYPNLSLGTVYRNLNLMLSLGEVQKISFSDEADRYDGMLSPHYHHICTRCGAVHDIQMQQISGVDQLAQNFTEHKITAHQLVFFGLCRDCASSKDADGLVSEPVTLI
jgi:Fur family peroxide stress response transcriptional regulator